MGTSATRAKDKYNKTHYDTIKLRGERGMIATLDHIAKVAGCSRNKLILDMIHNSRLYDIVHDRWCRTGSADI